MLKSIFSFQELSELEALEVKGGRSGLTLQYQCSNSVVKLQVFTRMYGNLSS